MGSVDTTLCVDGLPTPGIGGMARAVWRLVGFVLWDEAGSIERITDLQFRGRSVRIVDSVFDGRVRVVVTVGPPLGDPSVRCAVLELKATENEQHRNSEQRLDAAGTTITLRCSARIDLPGDRCRLVRRIAERVADREAGTELTSRVRGLAQSGRMAVLDGRGQIDSVIGEFLERVCR